MTCQVVVQYFLASRLGYVSPGLATGWAGLSCCGTGSVEADVGLDASRH